MTSFSDVRDDIRLLTRLSLANDGAILGVVLAYATVRTWSCYNFTFSALQKILKAPLVDISNIRSLVSSESSEGLKLVVVRGQVQAKSAIVDGECDVLVARGSGEKAVLLQITQTCISSNERKSLMWILNRIFQRKEETVESLKMVPFSLVEIGQKASSDYVFVDMSGSEHPLPLETVYRNLQPVSGSIFKFINIFFGYSHGVGVLNEEKVLSLGKEISAVGIPSLQNGTPQIKSCQDLPFFLSEMTKDEMVAFLSSKTEFLYWTSLVLGSFSLCILGYVVVRNWRSWREWWQRRQMRRTRDADVAIEYQSDEETEEIPDNESCVICLTRRRRFAFLPCGHLVSCHRCAISVEQQSEQCPVCRQPIRTFNRIYGS